MASWIVTGEPLDRIWNIIVTSISTTLWIVTEVRKSQDLKGYTWAASWIVTGRAKKVPVTWATDLRSGSEQAERVPGPERVYMGTWQFDGWIDKVGSGGLLDRNRSGHIGTITIIFTTFWIVSEGESPRTREGIHGQQNPFWIGIDGENLPDRNGGTKSQDPRGPGGLLDRNRSWHIVTITIISTFWIGTEEKVPGPGRVYMGNTTLWIVSEGEKVPGPARMYMGRLLDLPGPERIASPFWIRTDGESKGIRELQADWSKPSGSQQKETCPKTRKESKSHGHIIFWGTNTVGIGFLGVILDLNGRNSSGRIWNIGVVAIMFNTFWIATEVTKVPVTQAHIALDHNRAKKARLWACSEHLLDRNRNGHIDVVTITTILATF
ncbi:hypothetical protein EDC01DRAFT_777631 [Geopyxis carbonaria]|nr:hypothetical protein EDC01DRAFT_777631 [Geopyxis carbonaria]